MLTTARKFETSSNDTVYITQHLNEDPGETDYGTQIAPWTKSTVWEIKETINGFVVEAVRTGQQQQSTFSGYTKPSSASIPENHVDEMKRKLIFDLPITNTNELTFVNLNGNVIQKNKDKVEQ